MAHFDEYLTCNEAYSSVADTRRELHFSVLRWRGRLGLMS